MKIQIALLWSDWLIWILFFIVFIIFIHTLHKPNLRTQWRHVLQSQLGMVAFLIFLAYAVIGLLDCIHLNITTHTQSQRFVSVLDLILDPLAKEQEVTYSAPFALNSFNRMVTVQPNGQLGMNYLRLKFSGPNIKTESERNKDIYNKIIRGLWVATSSFILFLIGSILILTRGRWKKSTQLIHQLFRGQHDLAWRSGLITLLMLWLFIIIISELMFNYHIFGTNKIGQDVFYLTIKSIRTGLLIGTLTTLFTIPFALLLGMAAGYYRGWIDTMIQYAYTTLSSIPGVLLISAMVLVLEVYMQQHAYLFPTIEIRADVRLLVLCLILGLTSWATLCRLLRAETLKIRQLEFVQAARAFGVSQPKIIMRHVLPNVMHIVIITVVLDFSALVLTEAVLSYIGVGVDPTTISWGNMINSSRLELAREPAVWWPLLAALIFMFILVLAANLFADAIRDAFDPRIHSHFYTDNT